MRYLVKAVHVELTNERAEIGMLEKTGQELSAKLVGRGDYDGMV